MTYLAFDVARCSGQTGPAKHPDQPTDERGLWPDCVDCKRRTAPLVESGQKRHTIRQTAKGAARGATAYLCTGQRTAHCRKLGEGTITDVLPIEIGRHACSEPYASITERDGKRTHLAHEHLDSLAKADGFANGEEMAEWFAAQYGLPFAGYLHQWVPSNADAQGR